MHADLYPSRSVWGGVSSLFPDESFNEANVSFKTNINENSIPQNYFEDFLNLDFINNLKPLCIQNDFQYKTHQEHTYCTSSRNYFIREHDDLEFEGDKVDGNFALYTTDYTVSGMESKDLIFQTDDESCIRNNEHENQLYLEENLVDLNDIFNVFSKLKKNENLNDSINNFGENCLISCNDDDYINNIFDFDVLNSFINYEDDERSSGYVDLNDGNKDNFKINNEDEEIDIIHDDDGDICSENSVNSYCDYINGDEKFKDLSKEFIFHNNIKNNYTDENKKFKTIYLDDDNVDYDDYYDNDDDEFEPYLKKPINKKKLNKKKNSFGKLNRNDGKETRKREQNKEAATRYRQKKKQMEIDQQNLRRLLVLRNQSLKKNIAKKEAQIQLLKCLILND